jgi:sugar fermentation stimulation protein A
VQVALETGGLPEFRGWSLERREFRMEGSRFDFLLSGPRGDRLVLEVKSVSLVEDGVAYFPDAVTARGTRHVKELTRLVGRRGWNAAVLFVLQREDAGRIVAARSIDPEFADALTCAREAGVEVYGRRCVVYQDRLALGSAVPVE